MKVILAIALFSAAAMTASTLEISFGGCDLPKNARFDRAKFSGEWHEINRTEVPFEPYLTCATADVSFFEDGNLSWKLKGRGLFNVPLEISFLGEKSGSDNVFEIYILNTGYKSSLVVLDTDYENYAVVMACSSYYGSINAKDAWILGRTSNLPQEVIAKGLKTLSRYEIASNKLGAVNQGCE